MSRRFRRCEKEGMKKQTNKEGTNVVKTMYITLRNDEWNEGMREGIKAGEIEMTANGEKALLCQTMPFIINDELLDCVVMEFRKRKDEIYVDYDDFGTIEQTETGVKKEEVKTFADLNVEEFEAKYELLGAYVKEIKKGEIVNVRYMKEEDWE